LKIGKFKVSKKAVSPVIATLLMIAVAVAASVIVYVWSAGLLGTLMGGAQTKEQLILEAYDWTGANLVLYVRNVGSTDVTLAAIYVAGEQEPATNVIAVKTGVQVTLTGLTATYTSGTAYTIKMITVTGGVFSFTCINGSSG